MLLPSTMMRASQLLAALLHDTPQYTDDLAFVTLYMSPDRTAALGRGSPRSAQAASAARAASSSSLYAPRYLKLAVREGAGRETLTSAPRCVEFVPSTCRLACNS
jgi:hypothetical protein